MLIGTSMESEILPNELIALEVIVGAGFLGWMMLMYVHTVLLANFFRGEKVSLDEPSLKEERKHSHYDLPKAA